MPRFSIIVPIYQVESYLRDCLASIQAQTCPDFEALCVIDGATDGSEAIAREFAGRDARFQVLVKENGGLSSARNYGIDRASGEIVLFVDADDQIAPNCCERLSEAFDATGARVVVFGMEVVSDEPPSAWFDRACTPPEAVFDEFGGDVMFADWATPYAQRNAVRRDVFEQAGVRFDEEVRFAEDVVFQFDLYPKAGRIAAIPDKLYRYQLDNPESLSHEHEDDLKRLASHVEVMQRVFGNWEQMGLLGRYAPELLGWARSYALYGLEGLADDERADHLRAVSELLKRHFEPTAADEMPEPVPIPERMLMRALLGEGPCGAEADWCCKSHLWGIQFDAVPEGRRRCARFESELACRGDGKLYLKCRIEAAEPFTWLDWVAFADGAPVTVGVYPLTDAEAGREQEVVVEAPLLDAATLEVSIRPDGDVEQQATLALGYRKARWLSRFNYRARPGQCAQVRDFERPFVFGRYRLAMTHRFEKGESAVWRFTASWAGDVQRMPEIRVSDARGLRLDARCWFMELQPNASRDPLGCNVAYYSVELPGSCDHFVVSAFDFAEAGGRGERIASGFTVVDPYIAEALTCASRELMKTAADDAAAYRSWFEEHRVGPAASRAQRSLALDGPLFSVVVEGGEAGEGALAETLRTLVAQSYARWEAVVLVGPPAAGSRAAQAGAGLSAAEAAHALGVLGDSRIRCKLLASDALDMAQLRLRGEFVAFARSGDLLEPDALYEYACAVREGAEGARGVDLLYCDEDVVDEAGEFAQPAFKSRPNVDALYCENWTGNLCAVRRPVLESSGGVLAGRHAERCYDAALRALEQGCAMRYVPRVLYHARTSPLLAADPVALETRRGLLKGHLDRRGIPAQVVEADVPGALRVRYELPEARPLVSIIIPSKDHVDLLDACLRSIFERATYDAYEIIVVENNSVEAATFEYYERMCARHSRMRVVRWDHEFNYSKIVNFGARQAKGEYYLFLNNDTEVADPGFIEEMVGMLQRPEVGVVGAKLLFRDGLLQNAGSGVGVWDAVVCFNQNRAPGDGGYLHKASLPGNYTAVGGACQMTRAETFGQLGGYDEELAVAFNDIDYCMRAGDAGYLTVYTPYAAVFHYEFASRGREEADAAKLLRWQQERGLFMSKHPEPFASGDLYTSPNLMRHNTYYRLGG